MRGAIAVAATALLGATGAVAALSHSNAATIGASAAVGVPVGWAAESGGTTGGAGGNYFENVARPTTLAQGDSPDGNLVERNNYYTGSGTPLTNGSVAAIPYTYTLDTASNVKSIVTAGAGAGKLGL